MRHNDEQDSLANVDCTPDVGQVGNFWESRRFPLSGWWGGREILHFAQNDRRGKREGGMRQRGMRRRSKKTHDPRWSSSLPYSRAFTRQRVKSGEQWRGKREEGRGS